MGIKTIVISGQPGTGSTTAARILSEKLSFRFFTTGQLFKDIAKGTVEEQDYYPIFKKICDEKNLILPNMGSSNDSEAAIDLWKTDFGKSNAFHESIDDLQRELAKQGNIVLEGKMAIHLINNAQIKIWLKSPLSSRAERSAERDDLKLQKAHSFLENREQIERKEFKRLYGIDPYEQENSADLVLDTTNLSQEQVVEKVHSFVSSKL